MGPESGRTECEHFQVDVHLQHPQPHPYLFCPTHSLNMHEAIQIEMEKEWIRGAIIMSEIMRRCTEAEVRGDLMMMDRELDLQRGNNGFPFGLSPVMGFDSPHLRTTAEGRSLEEIIELKGSLEDGEIETSPFLRGTADLRISEVKPVLVKEGAKEKEKIILLAKPDENISGSERSPVMPPPGGDVNEFPSDSILKKKDKVEGSCGLCQVHVNNECVLNEYLHGKKHKAKDAENFSGSEMSVVTPPPRGDVNESPSDGVLKKKAKMEWKAKAELSCGLCQFHVNDEHVLNQHLQGKKHKAKEAENISGSERSAVTPPLRGDISESPSDGALKKKDNAEWSCGLCQVHVDNERVLNQHLQGKKHKAKAAQNISGSKRSDITPLPRGDVNESPSDGVLKKKAIMEWKAKAEWSCGLCQFHVNDEHVLNQHLHGKKHKAEEVENISGSERSVVTPPLRGDVNESPLDGALKKKDKVEWSCGLCQVHVNNECVLNDHLRGKKHKAKEAENISGSKRSAVTPSPRGDVTESPSDGVLKKKAKMEWRAKAECSCGLCQFHVDNRHVLNQHLHGKKHKAEVAENISGSERSAVTPPPRGDVSQSFLDGVLKKKAKAEWSCGLCQVHVDNEYVFNQHLQGKKHKAKEAENISGSKRSAVTPSPGGDVNESPSDGVLKKKAKMEWKAKAEWSCGLFQFHISNEHVLNQHLQGKKHRAEEAENISGSERSAVTPPPRGDVSESPSDGVLEKKDKVEWSCGLCQVNVNNECVLNDHLRGKKHKAKEAALANTAGKNSRGIWLKITTKSVQVAGPVDPGKDPGKQASSKIDDLQDSLNPGNLKKNELVEVQKHEAKEAALANTAGKTSGGIWLKITAKSVQVAGAVDLGKQASSKIDDLQDNLNPGNLKKNELIEVQKVQKDGDLNKKEHEFWCEMCMVGAASENVMNAHINGKKHVKRLQKINRNGGAGSSYQKSIKPEDDELVSETKPDDGITKPNVGDEHKDDKMTVS